MSIIFGTGRSTSYTCCLKACKRSKVHGRSREITNDQSRSSYYKNTEKKTLTTDSSTNYDAETNNSEFEKKSGTDENKTSKMRQITYNLIKPDDTE